jgi:hypothetical protein
MGNEIRRLRRNHILVNELGDQTILYNTNRKAIHVLNPTARLIWDLCDGEHSLQDMEQTMRSNFSIPREQDVYADILRILDEFASKGLVE